ncbi:MAG: hypothetical protein H6858_07870 [Rhodospirillales bacterium]|nr:hypothetical protein [Alphaproteobacteria bacterium]MCB1839688.1 hypothetical protein [Alphaproteobacteria bacterium]MCB9977497.1 hypothetical protein [Rhodospirillales bacterium]
MKEDWTETNESSLLLGGKPFNAQVASDDEILVAMKLLPSGLAERTGIFTDWRYNPTPPASEHEFAAYERYNNSRETKNTESLREAIRLYIQAAEAYVAQGLEKPAANMYSLAAQGFMEIADNPLIDGRPASEHAVAYFDRAITLHDKQGHEDFSYRDRDKRYNAVAETVLFYRRALGKGVVPDGLALEGAVRFYERLGPESEALAYSSQRMQGVIDPQALRVEQKEIGFSDDQPLGTDNVGPCVALMVYSLMPGADVHEHSVTAVAHIDFETDVSSIRTIFETLPPGKKQVRLLGARFEQDPVSQKNLCKVVRALNQYDVDIISADIHQGNDGPSSFVVSPRDFSIREAVAGAGNKTPYASCAYSLITEDALYPLRVAFDTRTGTADRMPLFLDAYMVQKINEHYAGKDTAELYEAIRDDGLYDIGLSLFYIQELLNEYQAAWDAVRTYARFRLPDNLYSRLDKFPVYLGDNAEHYNLALIDNAAEIYEAMPADAEFDFQVVEREAAKLAFDDLSGHKLDV